MENHHHIMPIRFAILDSNILVCMGLTQLLQDLFPMAEILSFCSFDELKQDNKSGFVHFFVSSRIYFEHTQFFREQKQKTIVLVNGNMNINDVSTLNVFQHEKSLIRDIMSLRQHGHGPAMAIGRQVADKLSLTARETEVAVMLCKGLINKEIADRLNVGVTTIITHRKNIMEKLKARSLADVIIYCVVNGIVSIEDL